MKSYKDLLNDAARIAGVLKELTPEESASLKKCILGVYKAVVSLCEENGLVYMLAGGSCLGAVRHQGFIPWDDDLDMMMPRLDYQKLVDLLKQGALGDDYSYTYPDGIHDGPSMFLKVYRNDTVLMGLGGENSPYPQKVFIDVFPLDGMPKSLFARKIKGFLANMLRLTANMVSETGKLSEEEKVFYSQNTDLKRMVQVRRFLGRLLAVYPHRKWIYLFDKFVNNPDMSGMVGIPTGRKLYNGEVFPAKVFFPVSYGRFEENHVPLPGETDIYLKNLYNDYMELPPIEKRERHFFKDIKL